VLERLDQPLAVDLPLLREIRATLSKCLENGRSPDRPAHPELTTYRELLDAPPLYSGSFGMGSRDLQPEGIVAAVENMLDGGGQKRFFYLSIDFLRDQAVTPKQQIQQETIEQAYPQVRELAIRGSENPNLMPEQSVTVRLHSVGGWGAITTGKNLAMTLFDLLGYHIKANPKYGSEKKGQPTTYYLSAAPEPIRINCEYFYVDVVLSPDPNVFHHTNALAGLKEGGVFIIQSDRSSPEKVWEDIPAAFQKIVIDKKIRLFYLDAFQIARDEATDPDLQLRMQGIAFQGAFFAASPLMEQAGLDEVRLLEAIRSQLQHKFGGKGARVVEDNMRVVQRGFDEICEVKPEGVTAQKAADEALALGPPLPVMVERLPGSAAPMTDIHRFWEQTGTFYARGMGNDNLTDPFMGLGGPVPRHDPDPLPPPRVGAGELHRLRQLLDGVSRHGDPGTGERSGPGARHRGEARAQARPRGRTPAQGRAAHGAQPARPARRGPGDGSGRRADPRGDREDARAERARGRREGEAARRVRPVSRGAR
jgi:pyruvate-ferredoxin/flavodoxin oxidoreductase